MGYEMSKPNLRAELEADLKLVSEGKKDKQSVLQHYIQKYKAVFIESARKAKKLVTFVVFLMAVPKWAESHVIFYNDGLVTLRAGRCGDPDKKLFSFVFPG